MWDQIPECEFRCLCVEILDGLFHCFRVLLSKNTESVSRIRYFAGLAVHKNLSGIIVRKSSPQYFCRRFAVGGIRTGRINIRIYSSVGIMTRTGYYIIAVGAFFKQRTVIRAVIVKRNHDISIILCNPLIHQLDGRLFRIGGVSIFR